MTDAELEARLRRLTPAPPGPALRRRLEQARPRPAGRRIAWPSWLTRVALPLAAAAALVLVFNLRPGPTAVPPATRVARMEPVGAQDFILGTEALGIGHDEAGRPYRIVRSYGVRRAVWRNAEDGREIAHVEPRQQLLLARMDVY